MTQRVGVLGLGIMGSAMAGHLLSAGYTVLGYDPAAAATAEFGAAGGEPVASAQEVAEQVEVVITSLPTVAAAQSMCAALAARPRQGLIVVETSTLPLALKRACREQLAAAGMVLLDCPLSGTGAQARTRDLIVFGSGDESAFQAALPVLECFARRVRYVGEFGQGSILKFVANLLVAVHNVATAEAFALGVRAGLDPQELWDAVRDGAGGSVIFDKRGELMVREQYRPPTAKISMFVKDIDIVREFAQSLDLPTPMLDATVGLYERGMANGLADADAAALYSFMKSDRIDSESDRIGSDGDAPG